MAAAAANASRNCGPPPGAVDQPRGSPLEDQDTRQCDGGGRRQAQLRVVVEVVGLQGDGERERGDGEDEQHESCEGQALLGTELAGQPVPVDKVLGFVHEIGFWLNFCGAATLRNC